MEPESRQPVLPTAPSAPSDQTAASAALATAEGFDRGQVAWNAEPASVTRGASLATAFVPLSYEGIPIDTSASLVAVDVSGDAVAVVPPDSAAASWDDVRDLEAVERPDDEDVVALVTTELGLDAVTVVAESAVWVPVGGELRTGSALVVESTDRRQRFRAVVDLTTMTVAGLTPQPVLTGFEECPEPVDLDAPAGCVGYPDPDTAVSGQALTLLDDGTALRGPYVRVLRGTDASFVDIDTSTLTDAFEQADGRWGGSASSAETAAANVYYWMTEAGARLEALGYSALARPATDVVVLTDRTFGGSIAVTRFDGVIGHGTIDGGHSGVDAQTVLHEYAHTLFSRAAPSAWQSAYQATRAYGEANSDIVAWALTVPLDLDDPACFAPYVGRRSDPPLDCLRRLDEHPDTPPRHYYEAGNPWRAAMYELLARQVERAGESLDECLPESWCEVYATALLATTVESWPMLDRVRFQLADAATAFAVANDALGYFDRDLVQRVFDSRPALSDPAAETVTLTVQHPDPSALRVTFDVVDAAGSVICTLADSIPLDSLLVVDASGCDVHLPADRDHVWRATVLTPEDREPGRILELSISGGDRSDASVRPADAVIGGAAGSSRTVTIPAGAESVEALTRLDGVVAASGVGIDEAAGIVAVVDLLGPRIQAFDLTTGELRWSHPYTYGTAYRGISAGFTMVDGKVISMSVDVDGDDRRLDDRPGVAAYDASTGERRWFTPIDDPFILQSCGADAVCISHGDDGTRTRLSVATGDVLGDLPSNGDELPIAAIDDDLVSMTEGSTPRLRRWDPATGATLWEQTPAPEVAADTSGGWNTSHRPDLGVYLVSIGPASDLFGGTDGYTAALDPATGATRWTIRNTWLLPGFPDDSVYLLTYEPGFGLNASATGQQIVRVDPTTGRTLATLDPGVDPLELTFLFDSDGTTAWWRDGDGRPVGGHDMRTDRPVAVSDVIVWEVVPRDQLETEGELRSMPNGYRPVWITDGATVTTSNVPRWIGAHGDEWFAYVAGDGTVVIGRES